MRKKFPGVAGLQDVLLQQQQSIPYPWKKIKRNFIQIFHVNGNHWNCVHRRNGNIMIYDSKHKDLTKSAINTISRFNLYYIVNII